MRYVVPILAELTVTDAYFSVTMDGGHLPLADFNAGDASGRMAPCARPNRAQSRGNSWCY